MTNLPMKFVVYRDNITDNSADCTSMPSHTTGYFNLSMNFDGHIRIAAQNFSYTDNPAITDVKPKESIQS